MENDQTRPEIGPYNDLDQKRMDKLGIDRETYQALINAGKIDAPDYKFRDDVNDPAFERAIGNIMTDPPSRSDMGIPNTELDSYGIPQEITEAPTAPAPVPTVNPETDLESGYGSYEQEDDENEPGKGLGRFGMDLSGYDRAQRAIENAAAIEKLQNDATADIQKDLANRYEEMERDAELRKIAYEKQSQKAMADIERDSDELASAKVNANRFWETRSTGQKVIAGLSLFLGGFAKGLSGGATGDGALRIINDAINRDIAEQKSNIQLRKDALSDKKNTYQMNYAKYQDERAAEAATRLTMLKTTEAKLAEMSSKFGGDMAKEKAALAQAQLDIEKEKARQDFNLAYQRVLAKKGSDLLKQQENYVPGWGVVRNPKMYTKAVEQIDSYQTGQANAKEMIARIEDYGAGDYFNPWDTETALLRSQQIFLQGQFRELIIGTGTISESEYDRLAAAIPDGISPNPKKRAEAIASLKELADASEEAMQRRAKMYFHDYTPPKEKLGPLRRVKGSVK